MSRKLTTFVTLGMYHDGTSCGYCGSENTARSYGFVSYVLGAETYETLLNRGWRRSGRYLYKPDLKNTCCKLLEAKKFTPRREHRKDVNRFNRFVKGEEWDNTVSSHAKQLELQKRKENISDEPSQKQKHQPEFDIVTTIHSSEHSVLLKTPRPKSLSPAHNLTLELDSDSYTDEKYNLYLKYQTIIHKETRHENTPEQFTRFLCSSPIFPKTWTDQQTLETRKTGSFHQLYRLDGELVAFAVLDLLPHTVSSVYFVYDPEKVGKFGMGKVSAMREVALCIEEGYKYYGLGLFAAGCEKLRYKGEMQPSELLDPETYQWHPFEKFRPFFDKEQYYNTFPDESPIDFGNRCPPMNRPLERDTYVFTHGPRETVPYDQKTDRVLVPSLFESGMVGVHARDKILEAEQYWGHMVVVHESVGGQKGKIVKYWGSDTMESEECRENIRELVALLGSIVFEMIIYIS